MRPRSHAFGVKNSRASCAVTTSRRSVDKSILEAPFSMLPLSKLGGGPQREVRGAWQCRLATSSKRQDALRLGQRSLSMYGPWSRIESSSLRQGVRAHSEPSNASLTAWSRKTFN